MEKDKWIQDANDKWFVCISDVLLKSNTAVPHSLQSRRFLDPSFLNKARSTCGNISMAPSVLDRLLQALSDLIII
jgi:hypothetical protein